MSCSSGPSIVTSGLFFSLDPANARSNEGNRSIINWDYWTAGTGAATNYPIIHLTTENTRGLSTDPFGNSSMIWTASSDGTNTADGGWDTGGGQFLIDNTKLYRYSTWFCRTSATATGTAYAGCHTNGTGDVYDLSTGASQTNPYWHYVGIGGLTQNQWYLVVGHLFPWNWTGTTAHPDSGVYTVLGGKISALAGNIPSDCKFPSNATAAGCRSFFYYCTDTTSRLQFFQPRVDLVNGTEPSVSDLLSNVGSLAKDATNNSANAVGVERVPPISSDGGGCYDFSSNAGLNHTTAPVGLRVNPQPIPTTGNFTINCWVKSVPATVGQQGLFSNAGSGDGYRFGVGADGVYWLIGPTYAESSLAYTVSGFNNAQWNNVCCIYDRTGSLAAGTPKIYLYLNGVYQSVSAALSAQTAFSSGNATAYMAKGLATFTTYSGKLGKFEIYNRSLSATEITQNFQALRSRYSI